ncbi:MAG: hypothetical protein AAF078_10950 [Planctomycetota bacterium]
MIRFVNVVQAGQLAEAVRYRLAEVLRAAASDAFGAADAPVVWREVAQGHGWTAGRPSRTSVVLCEVPDDTPTSVRTALMQRVNAEWVSATGTDPNALLIFTYTPLTGGR